MNEQETKTNTTSKVVTVALTTVVLAAAYAFGGKVVNRIDRKLTKSTETE